MNEIKLESDAIVMTVGAMGTGKSTFLENNLLPHDIVSTDGIREDLTGNFQDQEYNNTVFEIAHAVIEARAKAGILTVIDSTGSRSLISFVNDVAKEYNRPVHILMFPELDENQLTRERMQHRIRVLDIYHRQVKRIQKTTFPKSFTIHNIPKDDNEREAVSILKEPKKSIDNSHRLPPGSYVIVPDLHGEYEALDIAIEYMEELGYDGIIQMGDIVDRGTSSMRTFYTIFNGWNDGWIHVIDSNHDNKFYRWLLKWNDDPEERKYDATESYNDYGMKIAHGLDKTLTEFCILTREDKIKYARDFMQWYESLPAYLFGVTHLNEMKKGCWFAHAGINDRIFAREMPNKADRSCVRYKTLQLDDFWGGWGRQLNYGFDSYHIFLGHEAYEHAPFTRTFRAKDHSIHVTKTDFGLGKLDIAELRDSIKQHPEHYFRTVLIHE